MGNQQLLLLIVGTIVVAIAIAVGISTFRAYQIESTGDEIQSTITLIASEAKVHLEKPASLGGGGGTFAGFNLPKGLSGTSRATYTIHQVVGGASLAITGKADGGQITAMFGTSQGRFSIMWAGQGLYQSRTKRMQPF